MTTTRAFERMGAVIAPIAIGGLHTVIAMMIVGCGDIDHTSTIQSSVSVSTYTTSGCSTSTVIGLSKQIADEVTCMSPDGLVAFQPTSNMTFSSNAVLPYLHVGAKADLLDVAASRSVQINSGFRTVAQQYLLYRWYQLGRCGISAAARPGRSNHESGRAVDLANYSSVVTTMNSHGWSHDVPGDPVHFDHLSSPDIRGQDVQAFQRLWNRNNPDDEIAEDGVYGPQTEARLRAAPATGFEIGADCATTNERAIDVVMIEGPDKVAPGAEVAYQITFANQSGVDFTSAVRVVANDDTLHDASWASSTEVGTLGELGAGDVGDGGQGVIEIPIVAPQVDTETAINADLTLFDGDTSRGTIRLAVTVTPNGDDGTSGDAGDEHDVDTGDDPVGPTETLGGCNAGGSTGGIVWLAPLVLVWRRRRRGV